MIINYHNACFFNAMSLQVICGHRSLQLLLMCKLLWIIGKIVEYSCCFCYNFVFRIFFLLDWLSLKARWLGLLYYLTNSWEKKQWIDDFLKCISMKCSEQTRSEFELGSLTPCSVPVTYTVNKSNYTFYYSFTIKVNTLNYYIVTFILVYASHMSMYFQLR